jgi:hypothetical protein
VAPTLVKYAHASEYEIHTRRDLAQAARELMKEAEIAPVKPVELLDADEVDVEIATTLLYSACHYPYKQLREAVGAMSGSRRNEIISIAAYQNRGKHDELLRAFSAGQRFRFDVLMDVGGFRDMHRHRKCTQIMQDYTVAHGYDLPQEIKDAGLGGRYEIAMARAADAQRQIASSVALGEQAEPTSHYVLPLAYRKRCLFTMDFAEVLYISELRTTEAGHWSYRRVAYEMYQAVADKYPALGSYFRVTDIQKPVDLLKR